MEVDRISESEDGERLAVVVYAEGEIPLPIERLPGDVSVGDKLRYNADRAVYERSPV